MPATMNVALSSEIAGERLPANGGRHCRKMDASRISQGGHETGNVVFFYMLNCGRNYVITLIRQS